MWTVEALRKELVAGNTSSRALLEEALARIADPAGEGSRAFIKINVERARAEADASDRLRQAGKARSAVEGLPISVKDLFDVAGDVTTAGSNLFIDNPPATADATVIARLRAAGAVIVGRTNMVELSCGAVGLNRHFGTPRNPWDRQSPSGRAPGGSSSGAGVAQADGMCVMALGSDTRGSIRHPAALCGVAGFKPTARRVPRAGAFPRSYTLDSVGPLANSIVCCAAYDAVLAGESSACLPALEVKGLRLLVPRCSLIDDLDAPVATAFETALDRLSAGHAVIDRLPVPAFDRQEEYFRGGGFAAAESCDILRDWFGRLGECDPRVGRRIRAGLGVSGADYVALMRLQTAFTREVEPILAPYDAFLTPTAPCIAPLISEVDCSDEAYRRWNARILRNTGIVNFLNGCAATLPCHPPGTAPVGLSVCGVANTDRRVLAVAAAIEQFVSAFADRNA